MRPGSALTFGGLLEIFDAQLASRHLDAAARWMRSRNSGFYTIGSSGHESNAAVAAALRLTDPALLHYRSGGFYLARAAQAQRAADGIYDVLLGLAAVPREPIAGGRHKVFGHRRAEHHPADLHDRLAPAASGRPGLRAPTRHAPWPDPAIAGGLDRGDQFR